MHRIRNLNKPSQGPASRPKNNSTSLSYFTVYNTKGKPIHQGNATDFAEFIENAVKNKIDLSGADLQRADIRMTDYSGRDFSGAKFAGANLHGMEANGANFEGADLEGAEMSGGKFKGSNFDFANLKKSHVRETDFREASFKNAELDESELKYTRFMKANLENASVTNCKTECPRIDGANLDGTNLKGTPLSTDDCNQAQLKGAIVDDNRLRHYKPEVIAEYKKKFLKEFKKEELERRADAEKKIMTETNQLITDIRSGAGKEDFSLGDIPVEDIRLYKNENFKKVVDMTLDKETPKSIKEFWNTVPDKRKTPDIEKHYRKTLRNKAAEMIAGSRGKKEGR